MQTPAHQVIQESTPGLLHRASQHFARLAGCLFRPPLKTRYFLLVHPDSPSLSLHEIDHAAHSHRPPRHDLQRRPPGSRFTFLPGGLKPRPSIHPA